MKRIFILLLASLVVTIYLSSADDVKQRWYVPMKMTPQVEALGLTNTISLPIGLISSNMISVYFVASQHVSHKLVARAFNSGGVEIGLAEHLLVMEKGDRCYIDFSFDGQMDIWSVQACEVGL